MYKFNYALLFILPLSTVTDYVAVQKMNMLYTSYAINDSQLGNVCL